MIEVVKQILAGDIEAFAKIMQSYDTQLMAYLSRMLNFNQTDAEDVLQETYISTFVNLATFDQNLSFNAWIYRIAHNKAVNLIKKKTKLPYSDYQIEISTNPNFGDRLESILSRLKVEDRNLLVMYHLQGLSQKEIGDIFKIPTNTVTVRLKRAKETAQKIITKLNL